MNVKRVQPKIKGRVRNPKPKTFRIRKIGKGVKTPKSKNMLGISSTVKKRLKENILKIKSKRRKIISETKKSIKKIEDLPVSIIGIEELSEKSIKEIQKNRIAESIKVLRLVGKLNITTRQLAELENKYKKVMRKKK